MSELHLLHLQLCLIQTDTRSSYGFVNCTKSCQLIHRPFRTTNDDHFQPSLSHLTQKRRWHRRDNAKSFSIALLTYPKSMCNGISFTCVTEDNNRSISFLECLVTAKSSAFTKTVYRKPTHSGRYLHFHSSHPNSAKRAVVISLINRASKICSDDTLKTKELDEVKTTLKQNGYPVAFIEKVSSSQQQPRSANKTFDCTVQIPYRKNTAESIRAVLQKYSIRTVFKVDNTIAKYLVHSKDKISPEDQTDCLYEIRCGNCDATYIGETSRQLKTRIAEHKRHTRRPPQNGSQLQKLERDSAIALHALTENHNVLFDEARPLQTGLSVHAERCCAEALAINQQQSCVNRSDGQTLSDVWRAVININRSTHTQQRHTV